MYSVRWDSPSVRRRRVVPMADGVLRETARSDLDSPSARGRQGRAVGTDPVCPDGGVSLPLVL
jgi:hypothetical protein